MRVQYPKPAPAGLNQNPNIMKKKIQQHVAVEELYRDSDGWWVVLKDGYNYLGCCSFRQNTLTSIKDSLSQIKIGNPY